MSVIRATEGVIDAAADSQIELIREVAGAVSGPVGWLRLEGELQRLYDEHAGRLDEP
jgi:hypothetical protein